MNRSDTPQAETATVTPRKLAVDFPDDIPKYWFNESPFLTHMLNVYTVLVPDNERYYIRQLRACLNEIEDANLRSELLLFFRQEGQHGIGHEAFWRNLQRQGVPYNGLVTVVRRVMYRFLEPILPRAVHLSQIACIEHINACLGQFYLSRGLLETADERMQLLFEWHFAEEIEHKAVAFDAFQAVGGNYVLRLLGGLLVFPLFYLINTTGTFYLLARDGELFKRRTWRDYGCYLFADGALAHALCSMWRYLKPGFHPWQTRDYELARAFFERASRTGVIQPIAHSE